MRRHRLIGRATLLVVLACASATFWPSVLCAQDGQIRTIKDQLVGNWMLISITTHVGTKSFSQGQPMPTVTIKDVQPYGANPKGKLIFAQNGRFASTIVNSDGSKSVSNDPNAPVEFEASSVPIPYIHLDGKPSYLRSTRAVIGNLSSTSKSML